MAYVTDGTLLSKKEVRGYRNPRLFTPPLVELTPETSYGYDVIAFARDILETPLRDWQQEAVIRAGELLPDGRPRFRTVLILVARQNGKTLLARVLILYWLFHKQKETILGLANTLAYAKRVWYEVVDEAQNNDALAVRLPDKPVRLAIGEETLKGPNGCQYRIAAANRNAGRSLTVHRLVVDEIREHRSRDAWSASTNAMNAVSDAQTIAISNQGDDQGVLLDELREAALAYIEFGEGDYRLGLLEWSAPDGCDLTDLDGLAQANPSLNDGLDLDAVMGAALRAKAAGGKAAADFRTEVLCQRVKLIDPAIDPDRWLACRAAQPVDLAEHRGRVCLALDVSMDGSHASLVAAAVIDGMVHVEVVQSWNGYGCSRMVRKELPELVAKIHPKQLGWLPSGPAAALTADLAESRARNWPPRSVELVEIVGEIVSVAMGLCDLVRVEGLRHPDDPMLNAHVGSAQKLPRGDAYAFRRIGADAIDGAYALAAATHLARMLPPPRPPARAL